MTDAPRDRSASPRGTGTSAAEIASSPTQVSLYLAGDPQAETDEQHVEPHDACDDEYEHLGHGVPQKADEPRPSFGGRAGRVLRQNRPPSGPPERMRARLSGESVQIRTPARNRRSGCGAVRFGVVHRRQEGITGSRSPQCQLRAPRSSSHVGGLPALTRRPFAARRITPLTLAARAGDTHPRTVV